MSNKRSNFPPTFDLFIGNFPGSLAGDGDRILRHHFESCGTISSTELRPGGRGDGMCSGFVRFQSEEARTRALDVCQAGITVEGVRLFTRLPKAKQPVDGGNEQNNDSNRRTRSNDSSNKVLSLMDMNLQQKSVTAPTPISPIGKGDVLVTHIESICYFWGQVASVETAEGVTLMMEQLGSMQMMPVVGPLLPRTLYATQFADDLGWYRVELVRLLTPEKAEVVYVDYGNIEIVQCSSVMELPAHYASIPPYATRYWLYGYQPAAIPPAKMLEGLQMLQMIRDKIVKVKLYPKTPAIPNAIPIRAMSEDGEVGPNLCRDNYLTSLPPEELQHMYGGPNPASVTQPDSAKRNNAEAAYNSSNSVNPQDMSKRNNTEETVKAAYGSSNPVSMNNLNTESVKAAYGSSDIAKRNGTEPVKAARLNPPPQANVGRPEANNTSSMNGEDRHRVHISGDSSVDIAQQKKLQTENADLRRELNRTKQDSVEIADLRRELNRVKQNSSLLQQKQKEMVELRRSKEELQLELAKSKENVLQKKIDSLLKDLSKVGISRAQFPSKNDVKDAIETAYDLVSDATSRLLVDNISTLAAIDMALSSYRASQAAISSLKGANSSDLDVTSLGHLITTRDDARFVLHQTIKEFLVVAEDLPLAVKGKQVELARSSLNACFNEYLKPAVKANDLHETMDAYSLWKAKKTTLFEETREKTDACRRDVASAMKRMRKMFMLNDLASVANKPLPDLASLIGSCQSAVDSEIKVTNEAQTPAEKILISQAVKGLVKELDLELLNIQKILNFNVEYNELYVSMQQWLNDKPTVDELKLCSKRIKMFKSKLRHLLADRADAQEDPDATTEERDKIDQDLIQIRQQLHEEFALGKPVLELVLQYPEFNLITCMSNDATDEYHGLLKTGRSLDQYTLTPVCASKSSVHKSLVCGKSVVLKELVVGADTGICVQDVLQRISVYSKVGSINLLRPTGVFCDQPVRVVVEVPYLEHNLASIVENRPLTVEETYEILTGLVSGLEALHRVNLVHGALHPNNVFVESSGLCVLADYAFTKTPLQRAERGFISSSGLRFVAPEVANSTISCASDMYNFGLLVLWMHHPNHTFTLNRSSTLDISAVVLPQGLSTLVSALIQKSPERRPTASDLLKEHYFIVPPPGYKCHIEGSGQLDEEAAQVNNPLDKSDSSDSDSEIDMPDPQQSTSDQALECENISSESPNAEFE